MKPARPELDAQAQDEEKSCGSPGRCNYSPITIPVVSLGTGITCRFNNLIYAVEYSKCGMHYMGQTRRHLMGRMVNHFVTIRGEQGKYPVGHHFSKRNNRNGLADVRLYVLDFWQTLPTDDFREACEAIFIYLLSFI